MNTNTTSNDFRKSGRLCDDYTLAGHVSPLHDAVPLDGTGDLDGDEERIVGAIVLDGAEFEDLAEEMDLTVGEVKSIYRGAMKKLRQARGA